MDFQSKLKELDRKWKQAVYKESSIREAAFLPITLEISKIEVKQFAPIHYMYLDFFGSPFLNGKEPTGNDLITFLWVVSPDFKPLDADARATFEKKCIESIEDFYDACKEVYEYLHDSSIDMPQESKPHSGPLQPPKAPYVALIANYIDVIAHQYGWRDEDIIQMPFARIYQYLRAIEARSYAMNGKESYFVNNLSDAAKKEIRILEKQYREAQNPS
jgi:hypothetical protein